MRKVAVALGILARPPVPGSCKTRLIPKLGADGAAAIQAQLITRSLSLARNSGLPTWLFTTDDPDQAYWAGQAPDLPREQQPEGDLGARMAAALGCLLIHADRALIIGTDCPALTPTQLHAAAAQLETADAVVLPAEDGGYVLIGCRKQVPALFHAIAWGSAQVMEATRAHALSQGLRLAEGPTLWDVDLPEDADRAAASGLLNR